MQPLLAAREPLAMQHTVDVACEDLCDAIARFPGGAKPVGVVAAAEEARPMPGCQRRRLIEKEQFGPAAAAHHFAPPTPELTDANKPCLACPALVQQGPGFGIVNDAAIAGEHPAMRSGDDVA